MVFSSVPFLFFFLPVALTVYLLPWNRWRNATLLPLSLTFYAWGGPESVGILVISILVNYLFGMGFSVTKGLSSGADRSLSPVSVGGPDLHASRAQKLLLATGIIFNVGFLFYYKYVNFLVENINILTRWLGAQPIALGKLYAPAGISFFTFHALSYLIDLYHGHAEPIKNPLYLANYISFFPKLLAGPIIQYHDARKDLVTRSVTIDSFLSGIERFILGLGKKVLLANPLATVADRIFLIPADELAFNVAWLGVIVYSLQIFFDFAGYSDMAIGLARMLGFELPENFNYPYIAQSVRDFWRRWHISLSRWLRDYLYIPFGGNRCSMPRQYFNLITVFLVCGLWHGASWNFIVWGLWYGVFLVLERAGFAARLSSAARPLRHMYTLLVVVVGWVFFRSDTLAHALSYLKSMAGGGAGAGGRYGLGMFLNNEVVLCLLVGLLCSLPSQTWKEAATRLIPSLGVRGPGEQLLSLSSIYVAFLASLFLLSCMSLAGGTHKAFIYFKF